MNKTLLILFTCWLSLTGCLVGPAQAQPAAGRSVAVGVIHGDYDHFVEVLRFSRIIDENGGRTGGNSTLVQLGDLPDRGPDTDKAIALLRQLERQARRAGGQVHALIGNHEAMNMVGDLRYVHPGEYEALTSNRSPRLRDDLYRREIAYRRQTQPDFVADDAFREAWYQRVPLGYVEHRQAWAPDGEFGRWVSGNDAVVKVGRSLFLHGGISPRILGMSIAAINDQVQRELRERASGVDTLIESEDGPLWYRGLATHDEETELAHVNAVLAFHDVDRIVVGHTPGLGTVVPRFGGKVLVIDTGISAHYGAHLASLVIENNVPHTLQRGVSVPIPAGDEPLLRYFESVAALEPGANALQNRVRQLQGLVTESPPLPAVID